jgi:hypothetical protein
LYSPTTSIRISPVCGGWHDIRATSPVALMSSVRV